MVELDLRKKAQDLINDMINKAEVGLPEGTLDPQLMEFLRQIMTRVYYMGWNHSNNAQKKYCEIIEKELNIVRQ